MNESGPAAGDADGRVEHTAGGVPLEAFAFAFAVGFLGLVETGIVTSAAEYRGGELFDGTFGVGYAGFLFSTV